MKKIITAFLCLCLSAGMAACERQEQPQLLQPSQKYEQQYFDVFDTVTAVTVYARNDEQAKEYTGAVHDRLLQLHRLFDPYNDYEGINNLKTINDNAGKAPVKTDKDLYALIKYGKTAYDDTDGAINIAMGATLELWHKYRDDAINNGQIAVPSDEELEATRAFDDITALELGEDTVFLNREGVSLNLGAIAKGYASDEAIKLLKELGCDSALVNLGGNVACYRGSEKEKPWKIGVQDALDTDGMIDVVQKDGGFLVSSGNYQRYYEYDGKKLHHIIDPSTLWPADINCGTTVTGGEDLPCVVGDMLSTALFIMPRDKADALAEKYNVEQVYYTDKDGNIELLK